MFELVTDHRPRARRRGRPRREAPMVPVMIRLTREQVARLDALASEAGVRRAEVVRRLVAERAGRWRVVRVDPLAAQQAATIAALRQALDRLMQRLAAAGWSADQSVAEEVQQALAALHASLTGAAAAREARR